jgi:hypothetical protein
MLDQRSTAIWINQKTTSQLIACWRVRFRTRTELKLPRCCAS